MLREWLKAIRMHRTLNRIAQSEMTIRVVYSDGALGPFTHPRKQDVLVQVTAENLYYIAKYGGSSEVIAFPGKDGTVLLVEWRHRSE